MQSIKCNKCGKRIFVKEGTKSVRCKKCGTLNIISSEYYDAFDNAQKKKFSAKNTFLNRFFTKLKRLVFILILLMILGIIALYFIKGKSYFTVDNFKNLIDHIKIETIVSGPATVRFYEKTSKEKNAEKLSAEYYQYIAQGRYDEVMSLLYPESKYLENIIRLQRDFKRNLEQGNSKISIIDIMYSYSEKDYINVAVKLHIIRNNIESIKWYALTYKKYEPKNVWRIYNITGY